jgi:hypothetical protein
MKEIPLTKGYVALVDNDDYDRLIAMGKWYYNKGYAERKRSYTVNGKRVYVLMSMHRIIANTPKGMSTDHIDGNPLNNQKLNLRICSHGENMQNCKVVRKNNTSGFRGVKWHSIGKKWDVSIHLKGEKIYLGLYADKIEAAKVYNKAAIKYYGEFARLNDV